MSDNEIVYLRTTGGVIGYNLEYLNAKIDEYNRTPYLVNMNCFWDWLSWCEGEDLHGIDGLWNKSTGRIHTIKRGRKSNED